MKIGIVGAGRAGTAIGGFLKQKGMDVTGFYSRTIQSAVDSAVKTDTKAFPKLRDLYLQNDVFVIAAADDAIRKVAMALSQWDLQDKILCHLSASYPATCLNVGKCDEATYLALHPLANFSSKQPPEKLMFALEGDGPRAEQLVETFKQHGVDVKPMTLEKIFIFYLAISFLNPGAVTMVGIGRELLRSIGIYDCSPFVDVLTENYRNAITAPNIRDALTGPIATEDTAAIKRLLNATQSVPPDVARLFKEISAKSMSFSRLDNYAKSRVSDLLGI